MIWTYFLCALTLILYTSLAVFWIVRSIIDMVDDRRQAKERAAWEAEKKQFEREKDRRDKEYHEARMKELNLK
ncbi:MAG: hypothetical protein SPE66_06475 [Bilifractor sp.]|nr:hypothetical protein [Bilifractor sp.]